MSTKIAFKTKASKIAEVTNAIKIKGNKNSIAENVVIDSRTVKENDCFVAIKGYTTDGHSYSKKAAELGASVIIMSDEEYFDNFTGFDLEKTCIILVNDTRRALWQASKEVFGDPTKDVEMIGITGTKGKTTTSYMFREIYKAAGMKTGLIGTMCNYVGDRRIETERTTPEAPVIQELVSEMRTENLKTCIMEVSSQGLHLERVYGCNFKLGVFTNLSPDHIGANEHKDMDDYAHAKARLFKMCEIGLINIDNPYSKIMAEEATCKMYTFGIDCEEKTPDFKAININLRSDGVDYDIEGNDIKLTHVNLQIPGKFSVYNSMSAIIGCYLMGLDIKTAAKSLEKLVVTGKAENVPTGRDFSIMIDYAHNPDSFINILTTVKAYAKRTVFLFGCGGDRNRPRALMGETAAKYADFTIITSDNPRSEDPDSIIRDIEVGAKKTGKPYVTITSRRDAIKYAIENAKPGDVIILAGKGHETYQIFKDRTIHFDEREVVREILDEVYPK